MRERGLPIGLDSLAEDTFLLQAGMLMPNPSLRSAIFWQWANQTLNVAVSLLNVNLSFKVTVLTQVYHR